MFHTTKTWEVLLIWRDKISVAKQTQKNPNKQNLEKHCGKTDPFPLPLIQSNPH